MSDPSPSSTAHEVASVVHEDRQVTVSCTCGHSSTAWSVKAAEMRHGAHAGLSESRAALEGS